MKRRSLAPRFTAGRVVGWAFLVVTMLVTLFPFYWMLKTALSSDATLAADPTALVPTGLTLDSFARALGLAAVEASGPSLDFALYLRNSVIVATSITVCQVFCCVLAAYAFSRLRWPGREAVFFAFLTALMIPPIFTLIPNYLTMRALEIDQTLLGIIVPSAFMTPFTVFLLRQFFLGASREVEEAAQLDGLGRPGILFRIIVPTQWTPIVTVAVLTYVASWNDYLWPLIVASSPESRVLTVALGVFKSQTPTGSTDWNGLMAAALIAALPLVLLYLILGRRIVDTIGFSGLK